VTRTQNIDALNSIACGSFRRCCRWLLLGLFVTGTSGCVTLGYSPSNLQAVPAHELPPEILGRPRNEMQQISISRLRQKPPEAYLLGPGDILGIYIQDVLGKAEDSPPVHFSERGDQPPALGFPVPIQEDGTIALPYVDAIPLKGKTLTEATQAIKNAYIAAQILIKGEENIIVTLIRRRSVRVQVIREESGGVEGVSKRGTGQTIDLPAYENDVLHALNETGGLPGTDAKNEIFIIRGSFEEGRNQDEIIAHLRAAQQPCDCPTPLPDNPSVTKIPIRFHPDELPQFTEDKIILQSGDIVYIPGRDSERFYTGGVLQGGDHLIPRDYDLDVLNAIALARGQLGSGGTGVMNIGRGSVALSGGGGAGKNASDLIIVRKLPCGNQLTIKVDLNRALVDPSHRILVQPGDTLILRYKLYEEVINTALSVIQVNYFLNSLNGN
jgi:protein involved in polysaccharide export with SLBB domain